jgi:hypothetical protein
LSNLPSNDMIVGAGATVLRMVGCFRFQQSYPACIYGLLLVNRLYFLESISRVSIKTFVNTCNKNKKVDIKFSAHDAFLQ